MIPLGFLAAARHAGAPSPTQEFLIFPLTYDEMDSSHTVALTRHGGAGPHVTPGGFEGDGYGARYTAGGLPAWANSGGVSLQASISSPNLRARSSRDVLVSLCADDGVAAARIGFAVMDDDRGSALVPSGAIRFMAGTTSGQQTVPVGRPGWKYVLRAPNPVIGGLEIKLQAVHFIDASTLVFSAHVSDTESVVYRVDLADNSITGEFTFGASHRHVASIAQRASGEVWAGDYDTGRLLRIDLDASFASGTAVILATCDASSIPGTGAIAFMSIGGTEYLVMGQYDTLETNGYLYLFDAGLLSQPSIAASDRFKRFMVGRRIQGLVERNGSLLLARNNLWGQPSPSGVVGWLQEFNVAGMAGGLADGATVNSATNSAYITAQHVGPAGYVEDLAVHPGTNDVFAPTEGGYAVADYPGFQGVWSSNLTADAATNHYSAEYNGSNSITVKVNGYVFAELAWTLNQAADVLAIGGPPAAVQGFTTGHALGTISNVALVNGPIGAELYGDIANGSYEPNTLGTYQITLINPGAETGSTAGWVSEAGGMTVRSANPPPFEGGYYFTGGNFVASVSRQRVSIAGVPDADIDAGKAWAKVRWQQAAYSDQDPGALGVRSLTADDTPLAESYAQFAWTPFGGGASGPWFWYPRCHPVDIGPTTRKLDVLYNASGRTAGTSNDYYADAATLTVYVK